MCNLMFAWESSGLNAEGRDELTEILTVDPEVREGMAVLGRALRVV